MMNFASDNASGAHPAIMAAVAAANAGYADSYGSDEIMDRVRAQMRDLFEAPDAAVYLVATGTAANALALSCYAPPWSAVYCHRQAHVEEDECGAPEFYTGGAKLVLLDGAAGKITPDALSGALANTARVGVHNVQRGVLSVTNVTEVGGVYTPAEVAQLAGIARAGGVPVHMDGARLANALAATGATPAEMTWKAGVDILSFGGTKNGCLGVEAVVIFDPDKAWEFELRRKRGGHLFSKHRFLSAQIEAYLADGLWMQLARHANAMGQRLARGLAETPGASLLFPADANMVFATWARAGHRRAQSGGGHYYFWPADGSLDGPAEEPLSARLVSSWCTTEADVDGLLALIRG